MTREPQAARPLLLPLWWREIKEINECLKVEKNLGKSVTALSPKPNQLCGNAIGRTARALAKFFNYSYTGNCSTTAR